MRSVDSIVNLSFRYVESDYVRALRTHYALRLHPKCDMAIAVVLAAIGVYLWRWPDCHWISVASIVVSAVFTVLLVAAFLVIPPLAFRRQPTFRDEYALTFPLKVSTFVRRTSTRNFSGPCIQTHLSIHIPICFITVQTSLRWFPSESLRVRNSNRCSSGCWLIMCPKSLDATGSNGRTPLYQISPTPPLQHDSPADGSNAMIPICGGINRRMAVRRFAMFAHAAAR